VQLEKFTLILGERKVGVERFKLFISQTHRLFAPNKTYLLESSKNFCLAFSHSDPGSFVFTASLLPTRLTNLLLYFTSTCLANASEDFFFFSPFHVFGGDI